LSALAGGIRFDVGSLEPLDDVVAEQEGVSEGFESEGVLRAGDHSLVGHPAEGDDELVVGQFTRFSPAAQVNHAALQVKALERGFDEACGPQERTNGKGTMPGVECPGTHLEKQRSHHEEIVPAHENDLDVPPPSAKPL
jgi:hypothetical protein